MWLLAIIASSFLCWFNTLISHLFLFQGDQTWETWKYTVDRKYRHPRPCHKSLQGFFRVSNPIRFAWVNQAACKFSSKCQELHHWTNMLKVILKVNIYSPLDGKPVSLDTLIVPYVHITYRRSFIIYLRQSTHLTHPSNPDFTLALSRKLYVTSLSPHVMHVCTLAPRFAPCTPPPNLSEMIRLCMYGPLKPRQSVCGACIDKFKCSLQDEDISLFKRKEKILIHVQVISWTYSNAATLVFNISHSPRDIFE